MLENLDKKRVLVALVLFVAVLAGSVFWLAQKQEEQTQEGEVAGEANVKNEFEEQRRDLQKRIDEIKEDVSQLKPQDLKEQAPVTKILSDLDDLKEKATESAEIFDIKGNICEEVKRRFCQ